MKIFYFTHFYTTTAEQKIKSVQEQCARIGQNPLFLVKDDKICGYILPHEALSAQTPSSSIMSIVRTCPHVSLDSIHDETQLRLIHDNGNVVSWTFARHALPNYTTYPVEPARIEDFGNFAPWLSQIAQAAHETNCRVYMVGGVVRDFVLHKHIHDIDFLVQGDVFPLLDFLYKEHGGTLHKEPLFEAGHWTTPNGCDFDFTVARSEWYPSPATIPVTQKGTILDDIMRRDFSINSMLISVQEEGLGFVIDATDGIQDLKQKSLRILHKDSFRDDPTRIFRGARYAGRYQLECAQETTNAMQECLRKGFIKNLAQEQIGKEIQKIFKEENPNHAWDRLQKWNILEHLFEAKDISIQAALQAWSDVLEKGLYPNADRSVLLWLTFIMQIPNHNPHHALTNVLKGGAKLWSTVAPNLGKAQKNLSQAKNNGDIGSILHKLTPESWIYLYITHPAILTWWLSVGMKCKTEVDGAWLIKEGCPKGPYIGEALRKAQYAAWMGYADEEQRKIAKNIWIQ